MNARGRTLLKVVGIINIIIGILSTIGSILLMLGGRFLSKLGTAAG